MNYKYTIGHIAEDSRWIYINYEDAIYDSKGFVELVKKISDDCNGKIVEVGIMRYEIIWMSNIVEKEWYDEKENYKRYCSGGGLM